MHDDIIFIAAAEKEGGTSHFPMVKSESLGCSINIVASFEHVVVTKYHHMHWFNQTNATYCGTNCDPPFLPSSFSLMMLASWTVRLG